MFHARGDVEVVDSPWETINVEHSAAWGAVVGDLELPGVCLSFPVHGGVGSFSPGLAWEKRENLGQTKLVGLRYLSASYQLQKPPATVNHKGGG